MYRDVSEVLTLRGQVDLVALDAAGRIKDVRHIRNTVVKTGYAWVAGALSGSNATADMKYIGIGTGSTAAATTDTALGVEVESRATGTQTNVTVTNTNDTYQCVGTVSITDTRAITEAGIFSASSGGQMLNRTVFAAINLSSGDSLQVTFKVTVGAAA